MANAASRTRRNSIHDGPGQIRHGHLTHPVELPRNRLRKVRRFDWCIPTQSRCRIQSDPRTPKRIRSDEASPAHLVSHALDKRVRSRPAPGYTGRRPSTSIPRPIWGFVLSRRQLLRPLTASPAMEHEAAPARDRQRRQLRITIGPVDGSRSHRPRPHTRARGNARTGMGSRLGHRYRRRNEGLSRPKDHNVRRTHDLAIRVSRAPGSARTRDSQ